MATAAEKRAARAGQQANAQASDVAGTASTVTAGETGVAPDVETKTAELEVHQTAGPIGGAGYVAASNPGTPVAVGESLAPGEHATAVVTETAPANESPIPGVGPTPQIVSVDAVASDVPVRPVIANPGAPEHLRQAPNVQVTVAAPNSPEVATPKWTEAKPDPGEEA